MPSEKLKPCPFCGGEAKLISGCTRYFAEDKAILNQFYVRCEKCKAYTRTCNTDVRILSSGEIKTVSDGAHDAIEAWNRRSGDA